MAFYMNGQKVKPGIPQPGQEPVTFTNKGRLLSSAETGNFLTGYPEKNFQESLLEPGQKPIASSLFQAAKGPGAGGAFGESADYYRGLLDPNSQDFEASSRPELRRFYEQTVPDIAEQFAGMGSGGLDSSSFRNSAVNAGTDLSERLASIRANLRDRGAQGLMSVGQTSLTPFKQNVHTPATTGLLGGIAEGAGQGVGNALGTYTGSKLF